MRLVRIVDSTRKGKKFMAVFDVGGRVKTVHFGAAGMSDFTKHRNEARKASYLARHRKNEDWDNPLSAGALARWVLWNKETMKASIEDFKRRYAV